MYLLKQFKTYFKQEEAHPQQQPNQLLPPKLRSSSFELIVEDIMEKASEDFVILGEEAEASRATEEQEGVENMYIKDFLLIGKRCEGRALTF